MKIWVSPNGNAPHAVRIKVCLLPGDRMVPTNAAAVAVRPRPRLVHGRLSPLDLASVTRWIGLNQDALIEYRDGTLSTGEFAITLRQV